jgi:DNA segregation ATPase FtsK/SpoIIIE, S-DNA-T family
MSAAKTAGKPRSKPTGKAGLEVERGRLTPFFSEKMRALVRARIQEIIGFFLGVSAMVIFAALATYSPADPSWNTVGSHGDIQNILGPPGAYIADALRQSLGYAGYLFVVVPIAWGWRLGAHRPLRRPIRRTIAALLGVLGAAVALAATEPPGADPLTLSPGGGLGLIGLNYFSTLLNIYAPAAAAMTATLAAGFSGLMLFIAMGAPLADWLEGVARLRRAFALFGRSAQAARAGVGEWGNSLRRLTPSFGSSDRGPSPPAPVEPRDGPTVRQSPFFAAQEDTATEDDSAAGGGEPVAAPSPPPPPVKSKKDDEDAPDVYELPPLELLQAPDPTAQSRFRQSPETQAAISKQLEGVLGDFGVHGDIRQAHPGPVVTLYELEPAPGTKSARVIGLADDIARSMCAASVRVAVVPGRNVIGVELPNQTRETVLLRDLMANEAFSRHGGKLVLALGKDIGGHPVVADLARFPHLLVAGTTGSGKSVAINTMILSLLYRLPPERCRFIMIDPKMLELSVYEGIPHLLTPVVTDAKKAVVALKWTVREMEERYRNMSKLGVRNVEGYNARLRQARADSESLTRRVQTGFDPDTGKPLYEEQPLDLTELPYIVVIVDEMADLMLVAGKDIEAAIQRLAQMARAAGIHLIMATQRPSVDVITGTIKANFPTRISFQVTSKIDSRTILGEQGAEQLLGQGDMLYMTGGGRITRVHGPFVSDHEVEVIVRHLKAQGEPSYVDAVLEDDDGEGGGDWDEDGGGKHRDGGAAGSGDELYDKAVAMVCRERKASTSFVQRQLRVGYNSAARLIERMEAEGVVSKPNHSGKRDVLAQNIDRD